MTGMKPVQLLPALLLALPVAARAQAPAPAAGARKVINVGVRPESVTRGFGGKLYVSVMNSPDTPGDGVVKVIDGETVKTFAVDLDEPKGICFAGETLFVTDLVRVWRIGKNGERSLLADHDDFPHEPTYLNDVSCEPGGKAVYVSDMGANTKMRDPQKQLWPLDSAEAKAIPPIGRVYRIPTGRGRITIAADASRRLLNPNGVAALGRGRLLVAEFFTGTIFRVQGPKSLAPLATGLRGADGLEQDAAGNVWVSSWDQGKLWRIPPRKGKKPSEPELVADGFQSAADFFIDADAHQIILPDMKAGTLTFIPMP
jgi:hypothetical protein